MESYSKGRVVLLTDLTGFLQKAPQGDRYYPGDGTVGDEEGDQIARMGDSGETNLTGFLLRLGDAKIDMEGRKSGPPWEKLTEEPDSSLVKESIFVTGEHNVLRGGLAFQMRSKPISNQAQV